jgi:hypothetical protein
MITCAECKSEGNAAPILHDEVWAELAEKSENLCALCFFERSTARGILLTLADLRPCPFNLFHRPMSWFDLFKVNAGESEAAAWLVALSEEERRVADDNRGGRWATANPRPASRRAIASPDGQGRYLRR